MLKNISEFCSWIGNSTRKLKGIFFEGCVYSKMALRSGSDLFWMAECFVFQEKVSMSFGFPLHANVDWVWITNFKPCYRPFRRPFRRPSRRKSFSSVFSNLKRFGLWKAVSRFMSAWGLFVDEGREKSIFRLLPCYVC